MIRSVTQKPWYDPNREFCDPLHPYLLVIGCLLSDEGWHFTMWRWHLGFLKKLRIDKFISCSHFSTAASLCRLVSLRGFWPEFVIDWLSETCGIIFLCMTALQTCKRLEDAVSVSWEGISVLSKFLWFLWEDIDLIKRKGAWRGNQDYLWFLNIDHRRLLIEDPTKHMASGTSIVIFVVILKSALDCICWKHIEYYLVRVSFVKIVPYNFHLLFHSFKLSLKFTKGHWWE